MKLPTLCLFCLLGVAGHGRDQPPTPKPAIPPPAEKEKAIELEPFKVHEKPIISFAVDIVIHTDPVSRNVTRILITRVLPRTDAERAGLQPGDEIVKLGGTPVQGLDATVVAGSPLGRLLLGRDPGDVLDFEIHTRRRQEHTLRAARHENAAVTFDIDFTVYADPATKRVSKIFISRVRPDTDAEKAGLRKGDEIVELDDQPVGGLDSALTPESPLGRLLLGRQPGETAKFTIVMARTQEVPLKAQRGLPFNLR